MYQTFFTPSQRAPRAFAASALAQAAYIYVLAPRYFDAAEAPDARGRRQTATRRRA